MLVGKCVAGVVMGASAAFFAALVLGLALPGSPNAQRWVDAGIAISFAVVFALALGAARPRTAWGRGFLACGLICLCLIVAPFMFTFTDSVDTPPTRAATSPMERINAATARSYARAFLIFFAGIGVLGATISLTVAFLLLRRRPAATPAVPPGNAAREAGRRSNSPGDARNRPRGTTGRGSDRMVSMSSLDRQRLVEPSGAPPKLASP
jgi:hypothetical protein